jgi:hypothetical protein
MKISKSYLKKIIKEELGNLHELEREEDPRHIAADEIQKQIISLFADAGGEIVLEKLVDLLEAFRGELMKPEAQRDDRTGYNPNK